MKYNVQIYAQWLDSAYLAIVEKRCSRQEDAVSWAENTLKIYALLGFGLVLSDMQCWDNQVIPRIFLDPEFRVFLDENEGFLRLIANPPSTGEVSQFAIAAEGARRASKYGWTSTVYENDQRPIVEISKEILHQGNISYDWLSDQRFPDGLQKIIDLHNDATRPQLIGMLKTIAYFASEDRKRAKRGSSENTPRTYYDILIETANKNETDRNRELLKNVNLTLKFINKNVGEPARGARSDLKAILHERYSIEEEQRVWNTAIYAWNCAIGESLGIVRTSTGRLPHSVPIDIGRSVTSVFSPKHDSTRPVHALGMDCLDLRKTSWGQIRRIISDARDERYDFCMHIGSHKQEAKLEKYLAKITDCVCKNEWSILRRSQDIMGNNEVAIAVDLGLEAAKQVVPGLGFIIEAAAAGMTYGQSVMGGVDRVVRKRRRATILNFLKSQVAEYGQDEKIV